VLYLAAVNEETLLPAAVNLILTKCNKPSKQEWLNTHEHWT